MQAILLVTVFSCLLAAANVAAAAFGADCTATSDCTDANNDCLGTPLKCACKSGYTAYSGSCAITHGTAGGECLTGSTCTGNTLVCESNVCKVKAGQTCTATTPCVSSSTCSTTCTCDNGYSASSTGTCTAIPQGKVNAACDTTTKKCTGTNDACTDGFCKCKDGFSGNKGDNDCSGFAPQSVSSWLLIGSIIMCLMTLSLP
ncbi:keratin-associated protein 5-3-like [Pomacea canaliculata]|uniref:keratin-associated protein 5-3-like n=1 Tax=Pomacea canaliculata TaxID=400727 RepID=UPI000D728673|nr:keratin-associated protein 5-3-like [Pomacea canaliculata]